MPSINARTGSDLNESVGVADIGSQIQTIQVWHQKRISDPP